MNDARASQIFCTHVMRKHARSFYLSTRFLPRRKREAIEALYAFFRSVDDTVDEGVQPAAWRRVQLEHYRNDIRGLSSRGYRSCAPWFPALVSAYNDYVFDREPLLQLIDGCERDLDHVRFETLVDLEWYAAAVAGTVGRSVIPILGAGDPDSLLQAEQLGIAMQYTNILRDVEEDRSAGRNYLPLSQFPAKTESDVMRIVAREARMRYSVAGTIAKRLPNDGSRVALLMAAAFYENILSGIERRGFDPRAHRVYVSDAEKLRLAAQCVLAAYTGFAIMR